MASQLPSLSNRNAELFRYYSDQSIANRGSRRPTVYSLYHGIYGGGGRLHSMHSTPKIFGVDEANHNSKYWRIFRGVYMNAPGVLGGLVKYSSELKS